MTEQSKYDLENIDIDIENYTFADLINIFDLDEGFNDDDIDKKIDELMIEYQGNMKIIQFLSTSRRVLKEMVNYIEPYEDESETEIDEEDDEEEDIDEEDEQQNEEEEEEDEEETEDENEIEEDNNEEEPIELQAGNEFETDADQYIKSYLKDVEYGDSIVNRKEGVEIVNGDKFVMGEERLPIQQEYTVPIVRGQINPNLKNIQTCILNIDSQFRQYIDTPSTDFTFDLSDPLNNTLSISLINTEIPHCWYAVDSAYGTNSFELQYIDTSNNITTTYLIEIENGNYTANELVTEVQEVLNTTFGGSSPIEITYNPRQNKITFRNTDTSPIHKYTIIFYNGTQTSTGKMNYNLGWICGFREFMYELTSVAPQTSITSEGMVDLYGTKYLLVGLDEFKSNNVTKGIVTITDYQDTLSYPSYYTPDISLDDPNFRFANGVWVPSGLKETQAFTINQIYLEKQKGTENRYSGNSSSRIIARIPVEYRTNYSVMFNANSHLRYNVRQYYGPIDITRMRITIYNDKGQIMNFNGQDYSLAFLIEQLYQY